MSNTPVEKILTFIFNENRRPIFQSLTIRNGKNGVMRARIKEY